MIFKYRVKHNGIVYPPGADVPVEGEQKPKTEDTGFKETEKVEKKPVKTKVGIKKKK